MQNASKAYKESMKAPLRNRGYIRATIGVVNSNAQKNLAVDSSKAAIAYYSNPNIFNMKSVQKIYATGEQNFSRIDGSMYFLPRSGQQSMYNNGLVSAELFGSIYLSFHGEKGLDIKGLAIDFGDCYPVDFTVENDEGVYAYTGNNKSYWSTDDVFNGTSFLKITPTKMINGQGRLRIFEIVCGVANTFSNENTLSYSFKDYVSPIAEILPSRDMTLTVDNQNLYYSADNPDSALAYMEVGQEIEVTFGYDVTGEGDIEWLPPQTYFLKSWSADDVQAQFVATDRFDYISGTYSKGLYRKEGISLYDLAEDVLADAGVGSQEYFLDPYLKDIIVYNPLPEVTHPEALQIIANAGRCVLYEDRENRIHIQSSFIPSQTATSNGETEFSKVQNIVTYGSKDAYALGSKNFSLTNGTLKFLSRSGEYIDNIGYISDAVADVDGNFLVNPQITVSLEAGYICYGISVQFRNVAPAEMHIETYYEGTLVAEWNAIDPGLEYVTHDRLELFDQIKITFSKGSPNSRVTVDRISIGDITDYVLAYSTDLRETPAGTRKNKLQSINVQRSLYRETSEEAHELAQETVTLSPEENECIAYISNASYDFSASVIDNASITCQIIESSNYYVKIRFGGLASKTDVTYVVTGKEYVVDTYAYIKRYHPNGEIIQWSNPLISSEEHAKALEEWLASYYLGDVEYDISWRGDPRIDANDLFYLELKNREKAMIRCYQNELTFNGGWNGRMIARKVVL